MPMYVTCPVYVIWLVYVSFLSSLCIPFIKQSQRNMSHSSPASIKWEWAEGRGYALPGVCTA